ncbi:hypothetical protein [Mycolicibacterium vaccae]|uniref:hypothetical protein n=1 Tax=Mycolicibacterium vaccae TaxID=1810 RepID=UPI003CFEB44C
MRAAVRLAACAAAGAVLGTAAFWVTTMFGPETLYHADEPVYDTDGSYHGLR